MEISISPGELLGWVFYAALASLAEIEEKKLVERSAQLGVRYVKVLIVSNADDAELTALRSAVIDIRLFLASGSCPRRAALAGMSSSEVASKRRRPARPGVPRPYNRIGRKG